MLTLESITPYIAKEQLIGEPAVRTRLIEVQLQCNSIAVTFSERAPQFRFASSPAIFHYILKSHIFKSCTFLDSIYLKLPTRL